MIALLTNNQIHIIVVIALLVAVIISRAIINIILNKRLVEEKLLHFSHNLLYEIKHSTFIIPRTFLLDTSNIDILYVCKERTYASNRVDMTIKLLQKPQSEHEYPILFLASNWSACLTEIHLRNIKYINILEGKEDEYKRDN